MRNRVHAGDGVQKSSGLYGSMVLARAMYIGCVLHFAAKGEGEEQIAREVRRSATIERGDTARHRNIL